MEFLLGLAVGVAVGHFGVQKVVDMVKGFFAKKDDTTTPSA